MHLTIDGFGGNAEKLGSETLVRPLLDRYPDHDKAPGALLKLGLSQYGLKQFPQAEASLRAVVQRYPGSDVARTADDRLRAMQLAGTR